jgi:hypothetical protein
MTDDNRPGTTRTFYSMRGFHVVTGTVLAVGGVGFIVLAAIASAHPHIHFFQADGGESTSDNVWGFVLGALFAWIGIRMTRVGVRISAEKIAIRGYFRTRTVEASEVSAVSLQPAAGESGPRWLPRVEVASGKDFWIYSFDCGRASKPPKPGKAATIREIQALLRVEASDPGGQPGVTHEDDIERSPSLQTDPASGTDVA